jgi:hypothetical protein
MPIPDHMNLAVALIATAAALWFFGWAAFKLDPPKKKRRR